ncbi:TetR/AcrR family transcriptional regulator [Streptacidiphilus melanogenes]|uniref:TetR/AcrR family transcriptional regulator n=1 Tax=Streptacidiphilus melanogenes TaxID=411235 RepID=UPI0005A81CFE|nr:TetR/AcrR family transcriptional regulator [Streptacidiphilus melanogenes]
MSSDTAARLVESMRELLWERGYTGTSPKAVLQRAGAGQGSMYHHFSGKADLAQSAVAATAAELRATADAQLSGHGPAVDRLTAYLRREREVLRGCPIGGLTQDAELMADPALRAPVTETLAWLRSRLAAVLAEAVASGELAPSLDPEATAAALVATLQGGYVLARAEGSPEPFEQAVAGVLGLLSAFATGSSAG